MVYAARAEKNRSAQREAGQDEIEAWKYESADAARAGRRNWPRRHREHNPPKTFAPTKPNAWAKRPLPRWGL